MQELKMGDQKDEIPENIKDQMSGYENAGRAFSAPQPQPILYLYL